MTGSATCSSWTREHFVDPIGTAGCFRGLLLVEYPLPWASDASKLPNFGPIAAEAKAQQVRLQVVVPEEKGRSRVSLDRWDSSMSRYRGEETVVEYRDSGTVAAALLQAGAVQSEPIDRRDVLICSHGARDRCCGSAGTRLHMDVLAKGLEGHARVRRTSHLGGHRFAPTALLLPEGTSWAFLTYDSLRQVVERRGPVSEHVGRYRGCTGLKSTTVQALERAVLAEVGWPLFDRTRTVKAVDGGLLDMFVSDAQGVVQRWRARISEGRQIGVPHCPPDNAPTKFDRELFVELVLPGAACSPP